MSSQALFRFSLPSFEGYSNKLTLFHSLKPVSLSESTVFSVANFSALVPLRRMIGCSLAIASPLIPFSASSLLTLSKPILSSLSIATVISTILSCLSYDFGNTGQNLTIIDFNANADTETVNTVSTICINSTSFSNESLPTTSASHW